MKMMENSTFVVWRNALVGNTRRFDNDIDFAGSEGLKA